MRGFAAALLVLGSLLLAACGRRGTSASEERPADPYALSEGQAAQTRSLDEVLPETAEADRLVIREGGHTCCVSAEDIRKKPVWSEVTDPEEIAEVRRSLTFAGRAYLNPCMCCGDPGMDWYKGDELCAITTVKHGKAIMKSRTEVVNLDQASRDWLRSWLREHGVPEDQMK